MFSTYEATIHCLNYNGHESKKKRKKRIAFHVTDKPVTLKQDQGHQIQKESEDPKARVLPCNV